MYNPFSLYNLYCINMSCEASIYRNSVETQVIFDAENLAATHICTCCRQPLFSAMDIAIERMTAEVGVKAMGKPYYNSSH
jgi:hypothetical protein